MQANQTIHAPAFHIELAGRGIDGRDRSEVVVALARLFRLEPNRAERLLADKPVIIKRGLDETQAQKYITAIRRAGAACAMVPEHPALATDAPSAAVCPKCGYTASSNQDSLVCAGECPACGIIIAKYLKANKQDIQAAAPDTAQKPCAESYAEQSGEPSAKAAPVGISPDEIISFPSRGPLVNLFGFCPLENPVRLKAAPAELKTATIYHRFWAAVASLCHCIFMGLVMQVPVGIAGGIYLLNNDMELTRQIADSLRGISFLLGFFYVTIVLPFLWKGHTYGMRAMRIVLVDRRYEHETGLAPWGSILRTLAGIIKWGAVLPLAVALLNKDGYGFEDLIMKTRQAALDTTPASPWNIALRPLGAALALILIIGLPGSCMMSALSGSSSSGTTRTMRAPGPVNFRGSASPAPATGIPPTTSTALIQLRAAVMQHMVETSSFPDTAEQLEQVLNHSFPPGNRFIQLYNENSLDIQGDFNSYELGIWQGDFWAIIDQQGRLATRDDF